MRVFLTYCSPFLFFLHACTFEGGSILAETESKVWAIALHGGAGRLQQPMDAALKQRYEESLSAALRTGRDLLAAGGTALDAVQATVMVLENNPLFNAGKGAVFTRTGEHELDASIMDGSTLQCGGVTMVRTIKNPVAAARLVMEKTPHVLLCCEGAERLAKEHGCEFVPQRYFFTERRFQKLQEKLESLGLPPREGPGYPLSLKLNDRRDSEVAVEAGEVGGTVGCVALDTHGNLAAATSTGGLTGKLAGRIGDSPINGAGNYANQFVAVGGTGKGEQFIRHTITARVAWLVESGTYGIDEAVEHCLHNVLDPGDGGLIAVDKKGKLSLHSTTDSMPRGAADSSGHFEVEIWFQR